MSFFFRKMIRKLPGVVIKMAKEFQKKQEEYQQLGQKGASAAVIKIKEDELTKMYQRIQDFTQSAEQDMQAKQMELLKPFQDNCL